MANTTFAITKRCPLCRTVLVWNEVEQWWDCPKCGNVVLPVTTVAVQEVTE